MRYSLHLAIGCWSLALPLSAQINPPVAATVPWQDSIHGYVRNDEYHWLREKTNPEVIKYLKAENAHTDAVMRHTRQLQEKLYRQFRGRMRESDLSVPVKLDSFYYYDRTVKGQEYAVFCRKKGSLRAREEVLLDGNQLARGHAYYSVDGTFVSPDHTILAFLADTAGSSTYTIYFKDLARGSMVADSICRARYMAWANDNRTVIYETYDSTLRDDRVLRHVLGTPQADDRLVYREQDPEFSVSLQRTRSKRYLVVYSHSKTASEARIGSADAPDDSFRLLRPRAAGREDYLEHRGDSLYIITNEGAENFRLMAAPLADWSRPNWSEVIPARDSVLLEDVLVFRDHCVLQERAGGLLRLRVRSWDGAVDRQLRFGEPAYTVHAWRSGDYHSATLRYTYSSLVTPGSVHDHDLPSGADRVVKRYQVRGGYDTSRYVSERIYATAGDGTAVPISLVHRKGLVRDGRSPCLLEGYGAYGDSWDAGFSANRVSLLDRGFVYAIAHVRGGQENGRRWYEDGKLLRKKNSFGDFIACAERLVELGYASPATLAIAGGSAGGLLVGAVVNARPGLFRAALMDVPFVDLINTMLDPAIPLTTAEYEEWGDPRDRAQYEYMASYAPYENIGAQDYPAMLVTGGFNDANVPYWEPAKWVARLRRLKTDGNPLLLRTDLSSGHGGPSGRYGYLRDLAFQYAFLLDIMGITK
ncbi:MAG: S9 family peptidase [Candidatus Edwardsbacteria bacterium]|nr:S9 family peptidase [Candidatus Edwardsbacteria bacterium]